MAVNHLGIEPGRLEGATLALMPGDPARVGLIAGLLDEPTPLVSEREFTTWQARVTGTPVVVTSTGIGGSSLSIAVEELAQLGVRTFVRVGTTGAIQPAIAPGDVVVSTAAVRLEGASGDFAPVMGLRAGAVCGVILNRSGTESVDEAAKAAAEQNAALVATSAAALLAGPV